MLATIAIVVYTKYDLNRFRRELAEDTIAIESNAPQQTQQDESEDDISFADFVEAISSDNFVAHVEDVLKSDAAADYTDSNPEQETLQLTQESCCFLMQSM